MRSRRSGWVAIALLMLGLPLVAHAQRPAATRTLADRLTRVGRGEARITQTVTAVGETLRTDRGRLTLEPPDRLRLDFSGSGERVTMRGDGGEWLQPATRQLLILKPDQSQAVVGMWRAFLSAGSEEFIETTLGPRRYRLTPRDAEAGWPDSVVVRLGPDRLPTRIEAWTGEQRWLLALSGWSFGRARGPEAFRLRAPSGYTVFEWPSDDR